MLSQVHTLEYERAEKTLDSLCLLHTHTYTTLSKSHLHTGIMYMDKKHREMGEIMIINP